MRWLILVCLLKAVLGGASQAASNTMRIGAWSGGPIFKPQSRQLEKCTARYANAQGIVISYSVDSQFRWRLAFSDPAWSFTDGYALSLMLKFGERNYVRGRAVATGLQTLEVEASDELSLFVGLWAANSLQVTAGGLRFEFELVGSNEVLSALLQCAARQSRFAQQTRVPNSFSMKVDSSIREEVTSIAKEILADVRGGGLLAYQPGLAAQAQSTVAWKAGLILSTLDVVQPRGVSGPVELPVRLLERDIGKCRNGFFFAWALQEIDQVGIARAVTVCPGAEGTTFAYHAAAPRAKGGYYLLTSTMLGSGFGGVLQQQLEDMDAKLRSVMIRAINRVAKQGSAGEEQEGASERLTVPAAEAPLILPLGRD